MNTRRTFLSRSLFVSLAALGACALPGLKTLGPGRAFAATDGAAATKDSLSLPDPIKTGGMPLMQALAERKSARKFKSDDLSDQELSNLLWAAWGVNRADGRRTVPTARNEQEVELYAAMGSGVWRYDGKANRLEKVLARDTRSDFGGAPLTLVYTAKSSPYAGMHLGSMYQNAGLYCASAELANVVKGTGVNVLQKELPMPSGYSIMIIQSVGMPG